MSIEFYVEDVILPCIDYEVARKVLKAQLRKHKRRLGDINYIFCSDDYLLKLNIQFLKHNFYTDVITFDYSVENMVAGDIYVSVERVEDNSVCFDQIFINELVRVISHGFLHLLKYGDKENSEILEMRRMEFVLLNQYLSLRDIGIVE